MACGVVAKILRPAMGRVWAWGRVALFMGLIFWSSAIPGQPPQPFGEIERQDFISIVCRYFDKAIHATVYAGLAAVLMRALEVEKIVFGKASFLTMLVCASFGALDEWHQSFVLWRESSMDDWLADSVGSFCMILLIYLYRSRKPRLL